MAFWKRTERKPHLQFRKTIKHSGLIEGVGLHSGETMRLVFHPAEEGTGLVFSRGSSNGQKNTIEVNVDNVIDTSLAVTLGIPGFHVQTVEHLMYAIFVLGVTDMRMEVQAGSEIPILDGSAAPFIDVLEQCEFHEFPKEVKPIVIEKPVMVTDGNKYLVALPSDRFRLSYSIDYPHPQLSNMSLQINFGREMFHDKIARARTFGFLREVEYLKAKGLAQGGSLENVLVFTNEGTVNEPRFEHEPLFHKVLDLVGDLALVGRPIQGHILGSRGGHALDVAFGKKILRTNIVPSLAVA